MTLKEKRILTDITTFLLKEDFEREAEIHVLVDVISELICKTSDKKDCDAVRIEIQKRLIRARKLHLAQRKERFQYLQGMIKDS